MNRLPITFACCKYDRLEPLRTGEVAVEGVDLNMIVFPAGREIFDRMGGGQEFDVAEFSASEFISMYDRGNCPLVALPVFPSRVFRHGYLFVNANAGIRKPKDLEGRRVGVPLYTQTAAIWAKGLLTDEFGVDLEQIHWVQGAVEQKGTHGNPHAPPLLRPVRIEQNTTGRSLTRLLAEGGIDAYLGSRQPGGFGKDPRLARLFPDHRERERQFFNARRIFPIMHLIVLRRDLHERHPWLATSLYKAFLSAKQIAMARLRYAGSLFTMLPWLQAELEEIDQIFDGDAFPYGIEPNRPTLEALVRHLANQGLIRTPMRVADLFVPVRGQTGH